MNITESKSSLDKIIKKSRVHLYKPIQIAEILYRDRIIGDIDLSRIETYKNQSLKWRDEITLKLVGRKSTSSAQYQHNIFSENAVPLHAIIELGKENRSKGGIVEKYIYQRFNDRFFQLSSAINYLQKNNTQTFEIMDFINLFWKEAGLKRSLDKVYEIIVYSLFSVLVECLGVSITVKTNPDNENILREFEDFSDMVLGLSSNVQSLNMPARIFRVGITNAADRGLDMYANFGYAIQIKHLSLNVQMANNIVSDISADKVIIVCKNSESDIIASLLNQIGWKTKIQAIVTENHLKVWYEKALRGRYSDIMSKNILSTLKQQIEIEFPATGNNVAKDFFESRQYQKVENDCFWNID